MKTVKVTLKYEVEVQVEDEFVESADYCADLAVDEKCVAARKYGTDVVLTNFTDIEFEVID